MDVNMSSLKAILFWPLPIMNTELYPTNNTHNSWHGISWFAAQTMLYLLTADGQSTTLIHHILSNISSANIHMTLSLPHCIVW